MLLMVAPSMKITDSPAPMLVIPLRATAEAKLLELSSNFQPVMFTALVPLLVSSNQSAATGELLLLQGATSVMKMLLLTFSTVIVKISLTVAPAVSVAIALIFRFPTLSLVGVPLKVRVVGLKVNQLGKALPFSNVAE